MRKNVVRRTAELRIESSVGPKLLNLLVNLLIVIRQARFFYQERLLASRENGLRGIFMAKSIPKVIGLVGGIASGKSSAADVLVELGAVKIDADAIGHELLTRATVMRQVSIALGPKIVDQESNPPVIDRQKLAGMVFSTDPAAKQNLKKLEAILHPQIHAESIRRLRRLTESEEPPLAVVLDAPLLIEANWAPTCDWILYLDASYESRVSRANKRGWTEQHFRDRESAQYPLEVKKKAATHVIPSENEQEMRAELKSLWEQISSSSQTSPDPS